MLELGAKAAALHAGLKEAVDAAGVDLVFACGPNMAPVRQPCRRRARGVGANVGRASRTPLLRCRTAGDAVMIKGSLGSRMAPLVEAVIAKGEE